MGRPATRARSDPQRRLARPRHGCFYFEVFPLFIHLQPFFQAIIRELSGGWLAGTCEANRIYIYICGYTYTRTCRHVKYITHICRPIYTYIHIYIYIFICSVSLSFILVTVVDAPVGALQPTRPYRYSLYQIVVEAEAAPSPPFASGSSDGD